MSGPVDVLAVLDEFVIVVGDEFGNAPALRLREARDAAAKSIEDAARNERLFIAACDSLGRVSHSLAIDPNAGGHEPILAAIAEIRDERDSLLKVCSSAYEMIHQDPVDFAILGEMLHQALARVQGGAA
ncbi:hypothetical protein [Pseudoxanthomonas jiangsuensis]|uniref:hypothetical protein n=1 Tax=Pseudoxanthomonas jiangsuensis TaxID=619688 RepID=UPI0013918433|nr:hypothetical protein [Pseudoxanthomonas jiangsuensis]